MSDQARTERLFSYGTLQLEAVQRSVFGRKLAGRPDSLQGYMTAWRKVGDPEVARRSGKTYYPALLPSPLSGDTVAGTVFEVTPEELEPTRMRSSVMHECPSSSRREPKPGCSNTSPRFRRMNPRLPVRAAAAGRPAESSTSASLHRLAP